MSKRLQIKTAADFGYQLREERERRGMTQAELAVRADVSTRWLSNFERGKSPRAELIKVMHVARALGLTFELAEERQREISPHQQALVNAFTHGAQAPKMTPALQNALAQLRETNMQIPAISPAATTDALAAIEQMQKSIQRAKTQISPAMLNSLHELSAGVAKLLNDSKIINDEAQNGEA